MWNGNEMIDLKGKGYIIITYPNVLFGPISTLIKVYSIQNAERGLLRRKKKHLKTLPQIAAALLLI